MDELYIWVVQYINHELKQEGQAFVQGKFSGIGWLFIPYHSSTFEGLSPLIAVKTYVKTVNVYVMSWKDCRSQKEYGISLSSYACVFGKNMVGQSCIRIKKLNQERKEALSKIVQAVQAMYTHSH